MNLMGINFSSYKTVPNRVSTSGQVQFSAGKPIDMAKEMPRTVLESWNRKNHYQALVNSAPRGNQEPVLVFPGFMATGRATKHWREFLKNINYRTYRTGANLNMPWNPRTSIDYYVNRVEEIYRKNKKPVTLIGWSLGGIHAREVAKRIPDKISQVITVGSPINNPMEVKKIIRDNHVVPTIAALPPVPTTVIYSAKDGVVSPQEARQIFPPTKHIGGSVENISVQAAHMAMPHSLEIMEIFANKLAGK